MVQVAIARNSPYVMMQAAIACPGKPKYSEKFVGKRKSTMNKHFVEENEEIKEAL
jgi:hypothetical protein